MGVVVVVVVGELLPGLCAGSWVWPGLFGGRDVYGKSVKKRRSTVETVDL